MAGAEPGGFNAAADLLERNIDAGRADKTAVICERGETTYGELNRRVNRFASAITKRGVRMEERVLLCLLDSVDFPVAFLGAIKAGVVAAPVNTLLTTADYEFMLRDSRARMLVVSAPLLEKFRPLIDSNPFLEHVIVSGGDAGEHTAFDDLLAEGTDDFPAAPTTADDMCFWLYTSGSTGKPKGAVHLHAHMIRTAELYAQPVLGIAEGDVCYSAAKLFFAYGLGNALSFPFSVGAAAVLFSGRPTPESVAEILRRHKPTIFYAVPTLYAMLLASDQLPPREELPFRCCVSAGEALPAEILKRWKNRTGCDILDGIGSTEMLHIFISNRPDDVRPGSSGKPVPGYDVRIIGDDGLPVAQGDVGELQIDGPTSAIMYWNQREKSRNTFLGPWTRSGDKYYETEDGYFVYCGRTDDMLKVGGIYVSPFEVEDALVGHESILEVAVIGKPDQDDLIKPKAYVVLREGVAGDDTMAEQLIAYASEKLAVFKRPRWVAFVDALPKTATGKIQRFKLREGEGVQTPEDAAP